MYERLSDPNLIYSHKRVKAYERVRAWVKVGNVGNRVCERVSVGLSNQKLDFNVYFCIKITSDFLRINLYLFSYMRHRIEPRLSEHLDAEKTVSRNRFSVYPIRLKKKIKRLELEILFGKSTNSYHPCGFNREPHS